jgi:hypothetical protein
MSIEQTNTVDFVTLDETSGETLLTISDHLAWDENEGAHLELLQSKLNAYLRFIESGELIHKFFSPRGKERRDKFSWQVSIERTSGTVHWKG